MKILFVIAEEAYVMPTPTKIPKRWIYFVEIASYIKKIYNDVTMIDCLCPEISHGEILQRVSMCYYDVICCLARIETTRSLIKLIPLIKRVSPTTKVLVYGDIVNLAPSFFKKNIPSVDYIVDRGDWEVAIADYIQCLESKFNELPSHNGGQCSTFVDWEWPDLSVKNFSGYERYLDLTNGELTLSVSRGCPYNCEFCPAVAISGKIDRRKRPASIAEYMKAHYSQVSSFKLFSPTFTWNRGWVVDFCDAVVSTGRKMKWSVTTRPDCLQDDRMIRLMKTAGCYKIAVGIETLDEEANKELKKFPNIGDYKNMVEKMIRVVHDIGVELKPLLMIGIKGQTKDNILSTLQLLTDLGVRNIRVAAYSPRYNIVSKDKSGELTLEDIERLDKMTFINEMPRGMDERVFQNLIYNTSDYRSILA